MARELIVSYQGSATIYAVIRDIADSTVWNGSSFEAWDDGNIATYDVALTNRDGDLYSADMPSGIDAGDYRATYYVQAGGTPATSDFIVGTARDFHWNGTAASSVSSVTLSDYALTSLDSFKRYGRLSGSADDTLITETINSVSAFIERVTGRKFVARDYRERYNGLGQSRLQLRQFPVQHLTRVSYGAGNALSLTFSGSGIRANASVYMPDSLDSSGGLRLVSVDSSGVATKTNLSFATYPSVSTLVTAISAVSGWSASTLSNQPSRDLNQIIAGNALGKTVFVTYPDQELTYIADFEGGTIELEGCGDHSSRFSLRNQSTNPVGFGHTDSFGARRFVAGYLNILVEYNAGYTTVPADVEGLANQLALEKFYEGVGDPKVKSTAQGPFSVTFNDSDSETVYNTLFKYIDGGKLIGGG